MENSRREAEIFRSWIKEETDRRGVLAFLAALALPVGLYLAVTAMGLWGVLDLLSSRAAPDGLLQKTLEAAGAVKMFSAGGLTVVLNRLIR